MSLLGFWGSEMAIGIPACHAFGRKSGEAGWDFATRRFRDFETLPAMPSAGNPVRQVRSLR